MLRLSVNRVSAINSLKYVIEKVRKRLFVKDQEETRFCVPLSGREVNLELAHN